MVTVSNRSPVRVGQARSVGLDGLTGIPVTVDCDISRGLPGMNIVGLGPLRRDQQRHAVAEVTGGGESVAGLGTEDRVRLRPADGAGCPRRPGDGPPR